MVNLLTSPVKVEFYDINHIKRTEIHVTVLAFSLMEILNYDDKCPCSCLFLFLFGEHYPMLQFVSINV